MIVNKDFSYEVMELNEDTWSNNDNYEQVQNALEMRFRSLKSTGLTWMFHSVTETSTGWEEPEYSITADSFEKLITKYRNEGYLFKSVYDVLSSDNCKHVFLTFDDGYKGVFDYVLPICRRYSVPFCVFITVNYLGKDGFMSCDDLSILHSDSLCTIGSHTISHPQLRFLSDADNEREILDGKARLEDIIGDGVSVFAYPYGSVFAVDKRSIDNAKKAGFKLAFSTLQTHNALCEDARFFLPRLNMNEKVAQRLLNGQINLD